MFSANPPEEEEGSQSASSVFFFKLKFPVSSVVKNDAPQRTAVLTWELLCLEKDCGREAREVCCHWPVDAPQCGSPTRSAHTSACKHRKIAPKNEHSINELSTDLNPTDYFITTFFGSWYCCIYVVRAGSVWYDTHLSAFSLSIVTSFYKKQQTSVLIFWWASSGENWTLLFYIYQPTMEPS